jgi:hypothetical protein
LSAGRKDLNHDLAVRATAIARAAPCGSVDRRAALCAAVALGTTVTLAAARHALGDVEPEAVRGAALRMLEDLAATRMS